MLFLKASGYFPKVKAPTLLSQVKCGAESEVGFLNWAVSTLPLPRNIEKFRCLEAEATHLLLYRDNVHGFRSLPNSVVLQLVAQTHHHAFKQKTQSLKPFLTQRECVPAFPSQRRSWMPPKPPKPQQHPQAYGPRRCPSCAL